MCVSLDVTLSSIFGCNGQFAGLNVAVNNEHRSLRAIIPIYQFEDTTSHPHDSRHWEIRPNLAEHILIAAITRSDSTGCDGKRPDEIDNSNKFIHVHLLALML